MPLSPAQQRVYKLLSEAENSDVPIVSLYKAAYPDAVGFDNSEAAVATRYMQQSIGPIIKRINEKISGGRVRPGDLKRTYRLDTRG